MSPGTVRIRLAALRFFYLKTLKKAWSIAETPYPKRVFHLPSILSQEEVTRLIDAARTAFHRTLLMTLYATGARCAELTHLKVNDIDSKRMVIHIQGGKGRRDRDLRQAFQEGQLNFHGNLTCLAQPNTFAAWLRPLFRKDWVVYSKPPFGGPKYVLQYLGRYTHRVAISNHRLVSFTEGNVTFRWRDSTYHNEQKLLTLSLDEFLRRFLLHVLPKGFVRIRNFGFLANRRRTTLLQLCFHLLGSAQPTEQALSTDNDANNLRLCPKCGGPMRVIERLTADDIQLRSPPTLVTAAA